VTSTFCYKDILVDVQTRIQFITRELHDRSPLSVPDLLQRMIMVISSLPPRLGSVLAAHEYAEFPLAVDAGDEVRHGTFGSVAVQVVEQVFDVLDGRVLCLVDTSVLDCPDMKEVRKRRKAAEEEEEEDEGDGESVRM
jgi:hypothetical protein